MCEFGYALIYRFCCCDLEFDSMTLVYELDLDIMKTYKRTKSKLPSSRLSKVTDRHTETDKRITTRHSRMLVRCYPSVADGLLVVASVAAADVADAWSSASASVVQSPRTCT